MEASNKTHTEQQQQRVRAFSEGVYHWVVVLNAAAVGCSLLHFAHLTQAPQHTPFFFRPVLYLRCPPPSIRCTQVFVFYFFKKKKKIFEFFPAPSGKTKSAERVPPFLTSSLDDFFFRSRPKAKKYQTVETVGAFKYGLMVSVHLSRNVARLDF